jgi:hypothetical protein
VSQTGLAALLEAEAARFTLQVPDDTAATGVVELESLRERKPLASLTSAQVYALRNGDPQWAGMTHQWLESIER